MMNKTKWVGQKEEGLCMNSGRRVFSRQERFRLEAGGNLKFERVGQSKEVKFTGG